MTVVRIPDDDPSPLHYADSEYAMQYDAEFEYAIQLEYAEYAI
jgi:hypothetical protein